MSQYFLIKRGLYYRPDGKGYTESIIEAGLYSLTEAIERVNGSDGVTMKSVDQMLHEIDAQRENMREKLALLDKFERHALVDRN